MTQEFDLYGVFFPPVVAWILAAWGTHALCRRHLERWGVFRLGLYRPAIELTSFVMVLGLYAHLFSGVTLL